jgi:hypothetical protein
VNYNASNNELVRQPHSSHVAATAPAAAVWSNSQGQSSSPAVHTSWRVNSFGSSRSRTSVHPAAIAEWRQRLPGSNRVCCNCSNKSQLDRISSSTACFHAAHAKAAFWLKGSIHGRFS